MRSVIKVAALTALAEAARTARPGDTVLLEAGRYPLEKTIRFAGLTGVTLDFGGSVVVPRYDPTQYYPASVDAFVFEDCTDVTVRNVTVNASAPTNVGGRVAAVAEDHVDVAFDETVPLTGDELFLGGVNFGENWEQIRSFFGYAEKDPTSHALIAGEISTSQPQRLAVRHEKLPGEGNVWRIAARKPAVKVGQRCNQFFIYYGVSNFTFRSCAGMTMEDIRLVNCAGMGFVILPRCRDFTFRRVRIAPDCPEHAPYALTADGIHTTGLGGRFVMEDCYFTGLGDDCLNIHAVSLVAAEASGNRASVFFDKPYCEFPKRWAQAGDVLYVRDGKTLADKGTVTLAAYEDELPFDDPAREGITKCAHLTFTADADVEPGDFLSNSSFYADAEIRRCTFDGCPRCLVLQGVSSALVEDNDFRDTRRGVYLSSAYHFWSECGPVRNAVVRGNRFVRSQILPVWVRVNIPETVTDPIVPIHENITIEDNVIIDSAAPEQIRVEYATNVTVRGNVFIRCANENVIVE